MKNIKVFCGKPIINYPITELLNSNFFDEVIISTDSEEIANTAKEAGVSWIIKRPKILADDQTTTVPVIRHAVSEIFKKYHNLEAFEVCCVYPTNPFLDVKDIIAGYQLLIDNPIKDFVIPVTKYPHPIQRAVTIDSNMTIKMIDESKYLTRTQDLEESYHDCGQWYWGKSRSWIEDKVLLRNSVGFIMPKSKVQDIDTPEDWAAAELLFKLNQGNQI